MPLRVRATTDDYAARLEGRKPLERSSRTSTDLAEKQRVDSWELAAQPSRQFPEAKRHRRGTHVAADGDDRWLPRQHQPFSPRAK
jgi:hypothetical protein